MHRFQVRRSLHQWARRRAAQPAPVSCVNFSGYHASPVNDGSVTHSCRQYHSASPSCTPSNFNGIPDKHIRSSSSSSSSFCKHFSTSAKYQPGAINEEKIGLLPDGIIRQHDFFEEPITFVRDVNKDILASIDVSPSMQSQINQSKQQNNNDDTDLQKKMPVEEAVSAFDEMSLCILSRGSSSTHPGNDGDGPDAKAFHSSALAWSELLKHAWAWNSDNPVNNDGSEDNSTITTAPMLAVAAVAPVVAQGGSAYLHRIDRLLDTTRDLAGGPPSLWKMAQNAVSLRDTVLSTTPESSGDKSEPAHLLTPRERWHLHALHQLLQNNHREAMGAYLRMLEIFPGDLLGLSLALDVAYTLGDADAALRAVTNVSTFWSEREGGGLRPRTAYDGLATSLVAVGLSSSRAHLAERMAEIAIARDADEAGGISVWALSHSLASEGRTQEMVSKLAGFDGTQFYEACGYLHFHSRMKGYGAIALLDRRGARDDRAAIRLYDGGFGSILEYSGNDIKGIERGGEEVCLRDMRLPSSMRKDMAASVGSMFSGWFGGSSKSEGEVTSQNAAGQPSTEPGESDKGPNDQRKPKLKRRTTEEVLCWLPPSPLLLTQATALLFRLTLCDGIPESDYRWADLKAAWAFALRDDISSDVGAVDNKTSIEHMPLAMVAASLFIEPTELHLNGVSKPLECAMQGLHKMGKLMKFGQSKTTETSGQSDNDTSHVEEWREVLKLLNRARDSCQRWEMPVGMSSPTYLPPHNDTESTPIPHQPIGWDFDTRQFLEHALCFAAMEVGDYESLCMARSICSEGTTLRGNCPEMWWRYGAVLDMLGDEVAAENARAASVSLGSGEGGATP